MPARLGPQPAPIIIAAFSAALPICYASSAGPPAALDDSVQSRHNDIKAAMIAGPRNSPIIPKVSKPPRIPSSTHKNGRRAAPPMMAGRTA